MAVEVIVAYLASPASAPPEHRTSVPKVSSVKYLMATVTTVSCAPCPTVSGLHSGVPQGTDRSISAMAESRAPSAE